MTRAHARSQTHARAASQAATPSARLVAGIGTAVALYPVLRRQSEGLGLGNVTLRVVESDPRGRTR